MSSAKYYHPWFGTLTRNEKGYLRINAGPRRNQYLHRAVWEEVAGQELPEGWIVHHMKKGCNCPHNLVAMPECLHVKDSLRCPYTGEFISVWEFERRYGYLPRRIA